MSGVTWKIPKNCTFRTEEDGTGFAYHADTDQLHPLNDTGVSVMHAMAEGAETEEELFTRIWPEVESRVHACVRGDVRAFLAAMNQRQCLLAETEEGVIQLVRPKEAKGNGGAYSPPQVGDFGRAGLGDPTRNEFASESAGGACRDGSKPGPSRNAAPEPAPTEKKSEPADSPERDGKCDDGNGPVGQTCETGYTPTAGGDCTNGTTPTTGDCITGSTPGTGVCNTGSTPTSGNCSQGSNPASGLCQSSGQSPDAAACNPSGSSPEDENGCSAGTGPNDVCTNGTGPLNYFDCDTGTDPVYGGSCTSPITGADGRCNAGTSPAGKNGEFSGTCRSSGSAPEDAACWTGQVPVGQTSSGYCHEIGHSPSYANCYLGSDPQGPSGERCDPTGSQPTDGACVDGTGPDYTSSPSGGGFECRDGSGPNDSDCDSGNTPTYNFIPPPHQSCSPTGSDPVPWMCQTGTDPTNA